MAAVQEKAGDAEQARQSAEKALEIWRQIHNRGVVSIHAATMANTETLLARLGAASTAK